MLLVFNGIILYDLLTDATEAELMQWSTHFPGVDCITRYVVHLFVVQVCIIRSFNSNIITHYIRKLIKTVLPWTIIHRRVAIASTNR